MRRLLLVLLLCLPAQGREVQLFVRNQPFQGETRYVFGELFAPLDELLQALGCSWQEFPEGYLWISQQETPANHGPLREFRRLLLEGKPIQVGQQMYSGRVYVNVQQLAQVIGAPFRLNAAAGTADMLGSTLFGTVLEGVQRGNPESPGDVTLEDLQWSVQTGPPERMLGFLRVRNRGSLPLKSLVLRVAVRSGSKQLGRLAVRIPQLAPGATFSWQFPQWCNLVEPGAPFKLKVDWDYFR